MDSLLVRWGVSIWPAKVYLASRTPFLPSGVSPFSENKAGDPESYGPSSFIGLQSASGVRSLVGSSKVRFRFAFEAGIAAEASEQRLPVDLARFSTELEADGDMGGRNMPALRGWLEALGASKW